MHSNPRHDPMNRLAKLLNCGPQPRIGLRRDSIVAMSEVVGMERTVSRNLPAGTEAALRTRAQQHQRYVEAGAREILAVGPLQGPGRGMCRPVAAKPRVQARGVGGESATAVHRNRVALA